METCNKCPLPRRCVSSGRCIVYKEGVTPLPAVEPKPHPVATTAGVKMTGVIKKAMPKKAASKKASKKGLH